MKGLIAGLLVVFILLGTVACGAPGQSRYEAAAPTEPVAPAPSAPGGEGFWGNDEKGISPAPEGVEMPPVITAPSIAPTPAPVEVDLEESLATERMIVRTGDMSLVVADVAKAIEQIAELSADYEGYVVSSNSWRDGGRLAGAIAIRVPAGRFNDAIRALRQIAVEVNSESTTSRDVTEEYVDMEARLSILEVTEVKLKQLMDEAETVEESLDVNRELYRIQIEIEQTKGRMQYLEQTSSTSLINVRLEQAELDVNFTASNRRVKEGQDIRFDPEIAGGISPFSYEWDFGDGSTSTDVTPIHAYKSEGSYNVVLKVTDDRGNTDSRERKDYIDVQPGWSAGSTATSAWNGLAGFGRVLADFFIWLGYFSPLWIVIGVILYFAWWRRRRKKT